MIKVVHCKKERYDIYIGRGGKWGNPFIIGKDGDREKATRHSKKPQKAYEMIESLYPNASKIELFARNKREGWDSWGNEVESDINLLQGDK